MTELDFMIAGFIFVLNFIGFMMVGYDKRKARKGEWRVPEKRFFTFALIGGATGIYLGMKYFRHKTKHALFVYGIPFFMILNFVMYYFIYSEVLK